MSTRTASLSGSLRDLRESTTILNNLTENATQTIQEVERFIGDDCQLGIEARIPIGDYGNASVEMVYTRYTSAWRIALRFGNDAGIVSEKPWTDCSRDLKIWSIEHLPTLVMHLETLVAERIAAAEESLSYLDSIPKRTGEA